VENADSAEKTLMALIFFFKSHLPLRAVQGSAKISLICVTLAPARKCRCQRSKEWW